MKFYKGNKTQCDEYNNIVTSGEGYQGTTTKWAEPREIEGFWYIARHESYSSDLELVDNLPVVEESEE